MNAKRFGAILICAGLTTGCAHRLADNAQTLESRTTINAVLTETVGTHSNKAGDRVAAVSVEDFKTHQGVIIPRNSKLLGKVTYVRGAASGEYQSILGVAFDRAIVENQEVPLNAVVRAIAVARYPGSEKKPSTGSVAPPRPNSAAGTVGERFGGGRRVIWNTAKTAQPSPKAIERKFVKSPGAVGGLNANGLLVAESRGIFGLPGMNINERAEAGTQSTLISAILRDVKLENGTRILFEVADGAKLEGVHSGAMH